MTNCNQQCKQLGNINSEFLTLLVGSMTSIAQCHSCVCQTNWCSSSVNFYQHYYFGITKATPFKLLKWTSFCSLNTTIMSLFRGICEAIEYHTLFNKLFEIQSFKLCVYLQFICSSLFVTYVYIFSDKSLMALKVKSYRQVKYSSHHVIPSTDNDTINTLDGIVTLASWVKEQFTWKYTLYINL